MQPALCARPAAHPPSDFRAKGDLHVFVDECHRTQSGDLHDAMKEILPDSLFIGFTGTPLLKKDKKKSIEVFGRCIHTFKFDEAVKDTHLIERRHNDPFVSIMNRHLPQWRLLRKELNSAPLACERWSG